jgi:hypothetical protein
MKEWVTVLRAADAAARWHVHQRRKGSAQEPYINHLLEVGIIRTVVLWDRPREFNLGGSNIAAQTKKKVRR